MNTPAATSESAGINFERMLAELTSTSHRDWDQIDGPESRCGQDYWFANTKSRSEAYINVDQTQLSISIDGELALAVPTDNQWAQQFKI